MDSWIQIGILLAEDSQAILEANRENTYAIP